MIGKNLTEMDHVRTKTMKMLEESTEKIFDFGLDSLVHTKSTKQNRKN